MVTDPRQHHDALFRKTFAVVEHAAAEFRAVLPPALVAQIDFSTLSSIPGSFVDEALAGSQSDLLFSAQIAKRPAQLYVLFEHQSTSDKLMPLRLLRYVLRILERHVEQARKLGGSGLPLPPVIPVVLHHSETGWSASRRLEDLFDPELVDIVEIRALTPRLEFVLDDLREVDDAALAARAFSAIPAPTLWALRDARSPERLARSFGGWISAMVELLEAATGREALFTLFRYISLVAGDTVTQTLNRELEAAPPKVKTAMRTLAEMWMDEGEARGRAQGKAETLQSLLAVKFGALPDTTRARIVNAEERDLDRWLPRVLSAADLASVFADEPLTQ